MSSRANDGRPFSYRAMKWVIAALYLAATIVVLWWIIRDRR
jgi:hypothetical protein